MNLACFVDAILRRDPTLTREAVEREFAEATLAALRGLLGEEAPIETHNSGGVLEVCLVVTLRAVVSDPRTEVSLSRLSQSYSFSDCQDGDELLCDVTYHTLHAEHWSELTFHLGDDWFGAFAPYELRDRMEAAHKKLLFRYLPNLKKHSAKDLSSLQKYLPK